MKMSIGFIGIGLMGSPMAVNLARAGFDIKLWNRTPEKTQAAVEAGARRVDTAEDAALESAAVIFMLQDGAAVTEQLASTRLLKTCLPGTLVIDMSSISPLVAQDHAAIVQTAGLRYLDAPVSGRNHRCCRRLTDDHGRGRSRRFCSGRPHLPCARHSPPARSAGVAANFASSPISP